MSSTDAAPDIRRLIRLCHHRWTLPVLMDLHQRGEVRVASLALRVGTSRTLLRATLGHLVELQLVHRGAGRRGSPRYTLTTDGERVARASAQVLFAVSRLGIRDVALRKWSLPLVLALKSTRRFNDLKRCLPGITSRALAGAVKALQAGGLIRRSVVDGHPPGTAYDLTAKGRRLLPLAEHLG